MGDGCLDSPKGRTAGLGEVSGWSRRGSRGLGLGPLPASRPLVTWAPRPGSGALARQAAGQAHVGVTARPTGAAGRLGGGGGGGGAELRAGTAREARLPVSGSGRDWGALPFPPRPAPPRPRGLRAAGPRRIPPSRGTRAATRSPPGRLRGPFWYLPRLSPTALPGAPNPNLTSHLSP